MKESKKEISVRSLQQRGRILLEEWMGNSLHASNARSHQDMHPAFDHSHRALASFIVKKGRPPLLLCNA